MRPTRPSKPRAPAIVVAGALAIALVGVAPVAWAGPPEHPDSVPARDELVLTRIVPADDSVAARLRAELGVIGLETEDLDISAEAPTLGPELLDRLAPAGASAAIEIAFGSGHVDVWVADGSTGKTLTRRFDLDQAEPRTLAIAAVELLRASRLEFAPPPAAQHSTDDSSEQATERERPPGDEGPNPPDRAMRGSLSLAPMIGGSPGGLGLSTHTEIAGRWAPRERFALRIALWVPTLGNRVANEQGGARVFVGMAFVEPQLRLPGGAPWFHPELGLGLGAAVTGIVGEASEGLRSNTTALGSFAAHTHVGLGFEIVPRLWVRADGYVGILQPQPRVIFIDEVVARLGMPFASGSLGVEIWI
ncbi:hypothetical protein ENSA5_33770 [Enhygromyxa salina]|uniref:Uncharacterized protein n=1 Tax=Enhygromyxa salina TaxID=215803 RepID=A0A2S9XXB8_9BACT|nr:hypothetical protein [Enhygromyxa salina]PRP97484.1 hypothetical protein ENSA5_33770 [Enhygromyxa salina]